VSEQPSWLERVGYQRDWVWRGWQTRYAYQPCLADEEGFPLILLHGFGAALEHWRKNIPTLSQYHRVYSLDLLGFGASRKPYTNYNINLWSEQVYDFWSTCINKPVILVGNSIGSLVCLGVAAKYPEIVKGLALLSLPDLAIREKMLPSWLLTLSKSLENALSPSFLLKPLFYLLRRPQLLRLWAQVAYPEGRGIDEELLAILGNPTYDEGAAGAFCALRESVARPDFCPPSVEILPRLTMPILLVWGKQDRMVPPQLAPIFARLNPRIELIELEQAGHCLHDECPERFNPVLLQWLASHGLRLS
jgi:pimeloyl-ACP methyl ester carboxylesterase